MVFVFDTNSLKVLENYYPESFPTFWAGFEELIALGQAVSVREVRRELEILAAKKWMAGWVENHGEFFRVPTADEASFVGIIFSVRHFQALVGERQRLRGSPVADPWVVAAAHVSGGCVVTEEVLKDNAAKIPNVCDHFSVDCTNVAGFIDRVGWRF